VLRGGSFANNENNLRCAARNRNNPNNRNDNVGFRVCASTFFSGVEYVGLVASISIRRQPPTRSTELGTTAILPELPGGLSVAMDFLAEAKNGGAWSWPRPATPLAPSLCGAA
jgi:hypothetical protein